MEMVLFNHVAKKFGRFLAISLAYVIVGFHVETSSRNGGQTGRGYEPQRETLEKSPSSAYLPVVSPAPNREVRRSDNLMVKIRSETRSEKCTCFEVAQSCVKKTDISSWELAWLVLNPHLVAHLLVI